MPLRSREMAVLNLTGEVMFMRPAHVRMLGLSATMDNAQFSPATWREVMVPYGRYEIRVGDLGIAEEGIRDWVRATTPYSERRSFLTNELLSRHGRLTDVLNPGITHELVVRQINPRSRTEGGIIGCTGLAINVGSIRGTNGALLATLGVDGVFHTRQATAAFDPLVDAFNLLMWAESRWPAPDAMSSVADDVAVRDHWIRAHHSLFQVRRTQTTCPVCGATCDNELNLCHDRHSNPVSEAEEITDQEISAGRIWDGSLNSTGHMETMRIFGDASASVQGFTRAIDRAGAAAAEFAASQPNMSEITPEWEQ